MYGGVEALGCSEIPYVHLTDCGYLFASSLIFITFFVVLISGIS